MNGREGAGRGDKDCDDEVFILNGGNYELRLTGGYRRGDAVRYCRTEDYEWTHCRRCLPKWGLVSGL